MITEDWTVHEAPDSGINRGIFLVGNNSGDVVAEHIIDRDIADLFVAAPALRAAALRIDDALRTFKSCTWCAVRGESTPPDIHTNTCWVPQLREAIRIHGA